MIFQVFWADEDTDEDDKMESALFRVLRACGDVEASNATELPWNASDVDDQTCDGNLACAALGLSGFCCPQKDGYMFGCCPVLK